MFSCSLKVCFLSAVFCQDLHQLGKLKGLDSCTRGFAGTILKHCSWHPTKSKVKYTLMFKQTYSFLVKSGEVIQISAGIFMLVFYREQLWSLGRSETLNFRVDTHLA